MQRELRALRREVGQTETTANGRRRFTSALRERVCEHARQRVDGGERLADVAASLGLHPRSLWGWLRAGDPIREVSLVDDGADVIAVHERVEDGRLRLVLRGGVEVLGLRLDEVIALARALS